MFIKIAFSSSFRSASMFCKFKSNLEAHSNVGIILPTYCEAQNIERLIVEIENLPLNTSVLVIDDSSPDGTADIVERLQRKYLNILLLVRGQKSGLGSAITDGFRTFLSLPQTPEFVVTMDADYSHNPQDMPRLISSMSSECDLAIGSRYCRGGKTAGWPLTRKIVSRCANSIARGVLGLKLHDCTSGYRCYSTSFLRKTIGYLHSQTYDIQIETVKQAHSQGFRMQEVPILFVNRKRGKSKLSLREIENYVSYIFKTVLFR
jgi:dolichol-phosphate mannosyltransferase